MINGPIRKSCQKFVYSFVNYECHEKDDTINDAENDWDSKSRLVIIQLEISASPRNIHKQKITMKEGFVWHIYTYLQNWGLEDILVYVWKTSSCNWKALVKWSLDSKLSIPTKGQLISKCLFGVFNFFQKTNENASIVVKIHFIRFLEEFTAWQFAFEIIWPLP